MTADTKAHVMSTERLAYSISELSSALGISETSISDWLKSDQFPIRYVMIGNLPLFPADEVKRFLSGDRQKKLSRRGRPKKQADADIRALLERRGQQRLDF